MPYPNKTNREEILSAALTLLEKDKSLSMRTLAKKLGITAGALYRHYRDRDALESALAFEGLHRLTVALERASGNKAPRKALHDLGQAYITFTREHPTLYQVVMTAPTLRNKDESESRLWTLVTDLFRRIHPKSDAKKMGMAFWSFLHGFIGLERSELLLSQDADNILELGIKRFTAV
jgi:AcrR family transcriptional regulator